LLLDSFLLFDLFHQPLMGHIHSIVVLEKVDVIFILIARGMLLDVISDMVDWKGNLQECLNRLVLPVLFPLLEQVDI
jgi:hypothetical protein